MTTENVEEVLVVGGTRFVPFPPVFRKVWGKYLGVLHEPEQQFRQVPLIKRAFLKRDDVDPVVLNCSILSSPNHVNLVKCWML